MPREERERALFGCQSCRGDNASSTHLTIGNRANRRLLWCTDSSARYVLVQRDDSASFGDTKSGTGAAHEEQDLPISVGYLARLMGAMRDV